MELTWELKGFAINVSVLRRRAALSKAQRTEEQVAAPESTHQPAARAHENLLRASGSRYVGPMR